MGGGTPPNVWTVSDLLFKSVKKMKIHFRSTLPSLPESRSSLSDLLSGRVWYMYAIICKYMQTYANTCTYMQIYVRCPNFNFPELFGRFEFRILNSLKNYLGGSNFELRIRARFICRLFVFRINFERNYDRTFSLFQGVLVITLNVSCPVGPVRMRRN